jgi:hypothetical protein
MAWENKDQGIPFVTPRVVQRVANNRAIARKMSPAALEVLGRALHAPDATWADRIKAAYKILDFGTPSVHELRVSINAGGRPTGGRSYAQIPTEQLKAALRIVTSPPQLPKAAEPAPEPEEPK